LSDRKQRKLRKRQIFNVIEAIPFLIVASIARILPRTTALRLGGLLGRMSRFVQPERSKTAYENLKNAYPEQTETWIKRQVVCVFEHLGISGMEMLRLDKFTTQQDLDTYFTFEGLEHLEEIQRQNKGAFILSGHIGFWEVGTFFMPMLGFPVDFVAKKVHNPVVHRFFERQREAAGGHCIESKHGARKILRSLAEKRMVCLLLDQHLSKDQAILADFFGRPAYTTPIIAQIALKTGVPVVPVFVYRKSDFTYHVEIGAPQYFEGKATAENIQKYTQQITSITEEAIRKQPEQWFWVHRRWRRVRDSKTNVQQ